MVLIFHGILKILFILDFGLLFCTLHFLYDDPPCCSSVGIKGRHYKKKCYWTSWKRLPTRKERILTTAIMSKSLGWDWLTRRPTPHKYHLWYWSHNRHTCTYPFPLSPPAPKSLSHECKEITLTRVRLVISDVTRIKALNDSPCRS